MLRRIEAVIFDWAGTTVDFGSLLPLRSMKEAMSAFHLDVPLDLLRHSMGTSKADHIRSVLRDQVVTCQWQRAHGRRWDEDDVDAILTKLEIRVRVAAAQGCEVVPGLLRLMDYLKRRGILCGTTTGYTRRIMEAVRPAAKRQGFVPDCVVCSDEVPAGRPAPWMMYRAADVLGVSRLSRVVKVGDTPVDMGEAVNSGAWAVGVVDSSSLMSLSREELDRLPPRKLAARRQAVRKELIAAGAQYTCNGLADLPQVIEVIETGLDKAPDVSVRSSRLLGKTLRPFPATSY